MCERPGCTAPAAVSYGIDHSRLLVWMENRAEMNREMPGRLCTRHADALVMPRGWTIDDHREEVPRLFAARHLEDTSDSHERPARDSSASRMRRPRVDPPDPVRSLFDALAEEAASSMSKFGVADTADGASDEVAASHTDDAGAADSDDEETRAIPWTPRLAGRAGVANSSTGTDDSGPTMGRLLGRAFGVGRDVDRNGTD